MRRVIEFVAVLCLVAVACGGDEETQPVVTVGVDVAAEPVVTVGDVEPAEPVVTLRDNNECGYTGPSGFDSGTLVSFRIINESSETGGFAVLKLVEQDMTFDDFSQSMPTGLDPSSHSSGFAVLYTYRAELDPGSEANESVGFTDTGDFGVICITDPDGSNQEMAGALLQVE